MAHSPNEIDTSLGADDLGDIPPELDRRAKTVPQPDAAFSINDRRPTKLTAKEAASRLADEYVGKDGGTPAPRPEVTSPNLPTVTSASRGGWARRIAAAYRGGAEAFIETGRLLIEAKAALDHGEYEDMVERDLSFSPSTARKLVAIARDTRIANRSTVERLPPAWTILYEITKLDDKTFSAMLAEGSINPGMTKLVADNAVWLEKHRKGVRLKKISSAKPSRATARRPQACGSGTPQPLPPTASRELLGTAVRLAAELEAWPANILAAVRLMPVDDRRKLGEISDKIVNWWLRVHNTAQPHNGS